MSLGSIGVDRVHSFGISDATSWHELFALIAQVKPVLHRALCSNETIQNAPKHYKTHKNMSSGSNGVDRVRSLQKIPMRVRAMKFCVNCFSSACLAPSFM